MQLFLVIAVAHFLALLSPGPDFFLVARTSLAAGWRVASGASLGIALANGVFIVVAFAGVEAMHPDSIWFVILQMAGCIYLFYLGVLFICYAGDGTLHVPTSRQTTSVMTAYRAWWRALGMGFLSGILNPKNALFYASLVSLLTEPYVISVGWKVFYGLWMFSVVALWDTLVAVLIGNQRVLQRFARIQPWLERVSGVMLILLAMAVLGAMILHR
jgi:threonine/homoserine/homoserine lactone efflux protein